MLRLKTVYLFHSEKFSYFRATISLVMAFALPGIKELADTFFITLPHLKIISVRQILHGLQFLLLNRYTYIKEFPRNYFSRTQRLVVTDH